MAIVNQGRNCPLGLSIVTQVLFQPTLPFQHFTFRHVSISLIFYCCLQWFSLILGVVGRKGVQMIHAFLKNKKGQRIRKKRKWREIPGVCSTSFQTRNVLTHFLSGTWNVCWSLPALFIQEPGKDNSLRQQVNICTCIWIHYCVCGCKKLHPQNIS